MSKSKNNFTREDVKQQSQYKLWVCYKSEYLQGKINPKQTYYSYNSKKDGGYANLLKLVEARKHMIRIAILFDNKTNKELRRFTGL